METDQALGLLAGFRLEDGRTWGQAAEGFQRRDARALLSPDGERRHYWLRGRGMSKTSDAAGIALAALLVQAPARSQSYCYAVDAEQAGLLLDALAGFTQRTDGLAGAVTVERTRVVARRSGATLNVVASDGASAFGTRPWLQIVDELGSWPATRNYRQLWSAIVSAAPKVPGSRLLVATTAGPPRGLAHTTWDAAVGSDLWRAVREPGPSPWWSEEDVKAVRADLLPAEYRRLVLCEWAQGDDSLTSLDDVLACVTHPAPLEPRPGVSYVIGLDVGTRRDATAVAVAHRDGERVVVDRVLRWTGTRIHPVDLDDVEASVRELSSRYHGAPVIYDLHQAAQLSERLRKSGVRAVEFTFSQAGVNRLARALHGALRDRTLGLVEDEALIDELASVRLVETGPGLVKLDNPPGTHDDLAVAVGLCLQRLRDRGRPAKVSAPPRGALLSDWRVSDTPMTRAKIRR